ncbi:MAG: large conductance mechanosensitive channel protein MscL [Geothrix sp.]|jgi:large conductance mechanosensitive channel|uniref:Large-conductance mechanosensitive channel n=1 Tax=Candidatus Geothrix odensensis TaxID=2954440 RepID=A0A936K583_9BACT|nr:large conductance mechanosensitive channel protein MscL [Candidatus Geothrix odensensis]MBK8788629.1 large conductance mechanosensitive channel protein MscL [Holophagaceae bacterium]MCC6512950.1 large conductance mechanosensitive channel protein MscL [Geothrix sp.]
MSMKDEFKAFIMKGNVIDLAVAVVVGGAFGKIVTAFVDGMVMPLVTYVLPANIKWEEWVLGKFRIGAVLGASVNFLIIALVIFLVLIKLLGRFIKKEEAPAAPDTRECPACLEQVPLKATRCKHCTSQL